MVVGCDNSGPSGASPIAGVSDTRGHAYTERFNFKKSNSTTPNGAEALGVYTAVVGAGGMASSDVITVAFSTPTASRAAVVWQFRSNLGAWLFNDTADKQDEGFGTAISWSGFTVGAGVCVVACGAAEYAGTPGGDTDTQYGTWSPKQVKTASTGTATSSIAVQSQWKVPTTTGTQQYTSTVGSVSVDWVSVGFTFRDTAPTVVYSGATANLGALTATATGQILINQVVASGLADLRQLIATATAVVTMRAGAGCPFTRADQPKGDWAPGWVLVIDSYYAGRWVDITAPSYHIELGDGMAEGEPRVTVAEVVVSLIDPLGTWADMDDPDHPQPGTPLRVALVDPLGVIHPLITAELERLEDIHDGDHPRVVTLRAFSRIINLVVDLPGVSLPAGQMASARFVELATLAGWVQPGLEFPAGDTPLIGTTRANIVIRDEMDRTAQSAGWFMDADRFGLLRVRQWPHQLEGPVLVVSDCAGGPELVSHSIAYANDESHLLNYVVTTNDEILNVAVEDPESVATYGRRGRAFGFPLMGLAWSDEVAARQWASRVAQRFAWITRQVESFDTDTHVDTRWLEALADLDTGRAVSVVRTGPTPLTLDGVVTGWRYSLDPGRWLATIFTSTVTGSKPDPTRGGVTGSSGVAMGGVAPNDYYLVSQQGSWAAVLWPPVGAQADITVAGEPLGRYLVSTALVGGGKFYHSATDIRLSPVDLLGADHRAYLNTKLGQTVEVAWSQVTPSFMKGVPHVG
jgi:hypothetical protein